MNTKKILAVAAIALMSVPAYAAATQIVVGALPEQIVEGHTVFAVIEKARFRNETIEAAAVAVLVRERVQERENFKGVLWFNDQYLVSPYRSNNAFTRYPCGGAVLAVNAGDPDPRTMLVGYNDTDVWTNTLSAFFGTSGDEQDVLSQDADYANIPPLPRDDPEVQTQQTAGTPGTTPGSFQHADNAWVDINDPDGLLNPTVLPSVATSTPTAIFDYEESYLITDPNDHTWIIDKYTGISVTSINLNSGAVVETTSTFPLWAVNILGKPVFTPDDGILSCSPFVDDPWQQAVINENYVMADDEVCADTESTPAPNACPSVTHDPASPAFGSTPGFGQDPDADGVPTDQLDAKPPAIGYFEPTMTQAETGRAIESPVAYCYDGNAYPRDGDVAPGQAPRRGGDGCDHGLTYLPPPPDETLIFGFGNALDFGDRLGNHPLRLYNALLYFYTEDCDTGSNADDVRAVACRVPHNVDDTNGCQAGTEWHCPQWFDTDADGDYDCPADISDPTDPCFAFFDPLADNREGNSHPFNPPGIYVPTAWDPTNPANQLPGTGTWYDIWAGNRDCSLEYQPGADYCVPAEHTEHDRGQIDLYFSPSARPLEPVLRRWAELDYEGRTDEFHENNENPGAANFPGPEPGHPDPTHPQVDVPIPIFP